MYYVQSVEYIDLGVQGENENDIVIDIGAWLRGTYAPAFSIVVTPPVGDPYIAVTRREGNRLYWTVVAGELENAGTGECDIRMYDGDRIVKTHRCITRINETQVKTIGEDIPEASEAWVDTVVTSGLKAEGYAVGTQNGEEVEEGSEYYHNNAKYFAESIEGSVEVAQEAATDAIAAHTGAQEAAGQAETAKTAAEAAKTAAETAETNAETAETNAEAAQTAAETAQTAAEAAQAAAETAETNAETAQTGAEAAQAAAEAAAAVVEGIEPRVETLEESVFSGEVKRWNQLCANGNFVDDTGWKKYAQHHIEVADNVITLTVNGTSVSSRIYQENLTGFTAGHKYYLHANIKASKNARKMGISLRLGDDYASIYVGPAEEPDTWMTAEGIVTPEFVPGILQINYGTSSSQHLSSGDTMSVKNVWVTDLTDIYGIGNEPTLEVFRAEYPKDWYEYAEIGTIVGITKIDINERNILELKSHNEEQDALINTISGNAIDSDVYPVLEKIPTYWNNLNKQATSFDDGLYLERRINHIPTKGKSFFYITDTHYNGNEKHSIDLISYVRKRTGIKKVLFGGDALGYGTDKYKAKFQFGEFLYGSRWAFGTDFLPAVGDHDWNASSPAGAEEMFPLSVIRDLFVADLARDTNYHPSTEFYKNRLDEMLDVHGSDIEPITQAQRDDLNNIFDTVYYYDDYNAEIRYIVCNAGCATDESTMDAVFGGNGMSVIMKLALDFVANALMTIPNGWDIVVSHHKSGQSSSGDTTILHKLISGYARYNPNCKPYPNSSANANLQWWYPHTKVYDFSEHPNYGKILVMNGHHHVDHTHFFGMLNGDYVHNEEYEGQILDQKTLGQIPCITTKTDSAGNTTQEYPMTPGTITEQAFDVVTLVDDGIVITRFGEGADRRLYIAQDVD